MQNAWVVRGVPCQWQGVTLAFEFKALPSVGRAHGVVLARGGRCPRADPALVGFAGMRGPVPLARCASLSIITIVISPAEAAPAWMGLARRGMLGACRGPHKPGSVTG
jgi:hypothetical protein